MDKVSYSKGDKVWFRGEYAKRFSIRGVVEDVSQMIDGKPYGIRLENGNFRWADSSQLKERIR